MEEDAGAVKMNLFCAFILLLFSLCISQGKLSEYQLESESRSPCEQIRAVGITQEQDSVPQCSEDGRYRNVQCSHGGECWCVNEDGTEVLGSRQNGSVVYCLTSCQLQRQRALQSGGSPVPQCLDSGEYQPVQCDHAMAQCWCVDLDGMEIYGTRQKGKPSQCPGICKVRERRLLHGVGDASPPQCSDDGSFLPVQCKFINTTNMMVFDLLHTFNRLPEAFQTFSGFRKAFPELASYCYCADTRGRELPSTGVELLLDDVYDTAFSGLGSGRAFSQSNMYRILRRRYLAIQLALIGRFRCPSPCESDRSASSQAGNVFVPSCDARGEYMPTQCQAGGQCWCVDSAGREIFGSRQQGVPDCSAGVRDCRSKRRQALSRLFYGPAGHFSQNDVFSASQANTQNDAFPLSPCSPEFQELLAKSGLTRSLLDLDHSDVGDVVAELIQGMFPTGALALKALSLTTNPKRLQENLFGGKFLKNAGRFNFSGTVGTRGTLSFSQTFRQVGLTQSSMDLKELAKIFSNDSVVLNLDQEISDVYGRIVNLKRNRDLIKVIGTILENEQFFTLLRVAINLLKAEDSTQLGPLFQTIFQTFTACNTDVSSPYVPQCTEDGQYQDVQCQGLECWCVNSQGLEVMGSRSSGSRPKCSSQCEKERMMTIAVKASMSAGSEVFIPKCEEDGAYVPLQCLGKTCFCVSGTGARYNTLSSGASLHCPTDCQITASQYFLNTVNSILAGPSISQLSEVYIPRCTSDGDWHQIQCDGPLENAFEFYSKWNQVNNNGKQLPVLEILGILQEYVKNPKAMASFSGFLAALFQARHHKVFPVLAKFETFSEISSEILDGNPEVISGPSVLLNPLSLWRLLRGVTQQYPGPLSDFSVPLGHFNLRQCWCVDQKGDKVADSKAAVNQVPKCPGSCSLVQGQVDKFLEEAEALISLSNSSHVPVGYGFLLAESVGFGAGEMERTFSPGLQLAELLQSGSSSALRLAAHSTLHFYWQSSLMASEGNRQSLVLGYQPYRPQCDAYGQWLPSQCHPSTGHCWCVDEEGGYITGSLSARSLQPRQCQTACQRLQANSMISEWTKSPSSMNFPYSPSCDVDGEFSVIQSHGAGSPVALCVSPVNGQIIQLGTLNLTGHLECPGWCALQKKQAAEREEGVGYEPECVQAGQQFSPQQCDDVHCWCVSPNGRELPSTRRRRSSMETPSCDTPQCTLPFGDSISHGAVLCGKVSVNEEQKQRCEVLCHQGYASTLTVDSFVCDPVRKLWLSDAPLSSACQRVQPLQTVQASLVFQLALLEAQQGCRVQSSALQASLLHNMRAAGVCSLQSPGLRSSVSLCDESSVSLECVSERSLTVYITFKARLSDLPVNTLPDLHDIDMVLNSEKMLDGVMKIIQSAPYHSVFISERSAAVSSPASFGCSVGYRQLPDSTGCVVCPAGSFSSQGRCNACPLGSYQAEAGQDVCSACPSGTSTVASGASSPSHCVSKCQQSMLSCTEEGDFLSAQKHFLSGRWLCVTLQGEELLWTSADEPVTTEQCQMLEKFEAVSASSLLLDSTDAVVMRSDTSPLPLEQLLRQCVFDCARNKSCQHVAAFREGDRTLCDLYSTSAANVQCRATQKSKGFLGNEEAETFQTLSCMLKVKVGMKPNLTVLRKKGHEFNTAGEKNFDRLSFLKASSGVYRTLVFQSPEVSLADAHHFCADTCSQESCCDGFILNQNVLNGGSVMCGLLSFPAVLQCSEEDWDVAVVASSSRTCGAGLKYDEQRKRFTFEFGGQNFTITDAALPTSSKNQSDYQATVIGFQRIYLWKESDMNSRPKAEGPCKAAVDQEAPELSDLVKQSFDVLDGSDVRTDSVKDTSSQKYWLFKHQFTSEEAELWCLQRCREEELCHVADLGDEGPLYFACMLYPDTRVCGAYDKPLRQSCSLVLPQELHTAHQKKADLGGSVQSFYSRVPFKKMVSYSVRSRVSVSSRPITEGFFECERRCDEDPCCRGIGYINDTGAPDVLCLTLNSLGIQTCGEGFDTAWRLQDCSPSAVQTGPYPFGWYEKPVNQWTGSPGICPSFSLRSPTRAVRLKDWKLLDASSVLVDSAVSVFDIIHISRDIAKDLDSVRNWCLAACEEEDSCLAVTVASRESAVRCVMYPDSHTCLPTSSGQHCVLLTKEPAQYVYLRTVLKPETTSVSIPGHGTLLGENEVKLIGAESKIVTHFLGVPYARPPIGQLRFSPPQPADWTGTWDATFARPSCMQPGDTPDFNTSEDCLYLNIFVPSSVKGAAPVLVFLHNPASGLLEGSYLAAVGNIVVVAASFRVAAYGFLSTGSSELPGNFGLQDQVAALRWVQENIALFRGDPTKVTIGADRNGADIASLHLSSSSSSSLFHQALLMGGSAFSPAAVMSGQKAGQRAVALATELGCSSSEPTQLLTCLREKPAEDINAAQTKLLAVSGPLEAWSPVVDEVLVAEEPSAALRAGRFRRAALMIGSSAEDGLINRAKNIKNFEQLQGRADSKTAFYEALANSLGGEDANVFVKEAASWFYSLHHSPTPSGYNVFSRALENATRDFFITCPSVSMASFWASSTRANVYMYHLPGDMTHTSTALSSPLDVQYVFGAPHASGMRELFTSTERTLSLQMMTYMANFIKSGNPNLPLSVSSTSFAEVLPSWPLFLPSGQSYKELSPALSNRKDLQAPQCSFWSQYVPALSSSTGKLLCKNSVGELGSSESPSAEPQAELLSDFSSSVTQRPPKAAKDAYN